MEESNAFNFLFFYFLPPFTLLPLKEFIRLAYHLMLMHQLLPRRGLDEIVAAILAATSLAAYRRDDVSQGVEPDGVARQFLYPTDVISLRGYLAMLILALKYHRIGKHDDLATLKIIAVHPIHYHSIALLQLGRKPTCGHREDSENISAHCPSEEQRQHQC